MMKAVVIFLGTLVTLHAVAFGQTASPSPAAEPTASIPAADEKVYGVYPIAYKTLVNRWLETKLADPTSAVIDWTDAPRAGEYKTKKGDTFVGYVIDFKVNARNQFGAPTGKQNYRVVIRNGEVIWGGRPRY
jgi:hypothetical protein